MINTIISPGSVIKLHPFYPHLWEFLEVVSVQECPNDIIRVVGWEVGLDAAGSRGKRITLYLDKQRYELMASHAITGASVAGNFLLNVAFACFIIYIGSLLFR